MTDKESPPKVRPDATADAGSDLRSVAPTTNRVNPMSRFAALRRRQAASRRLFALECGCRDPWPCRCGQPPLSQQWVDAGADAARHILGSIGCVPLLEHEVLQALYRRGGHDRQLAQELNTLAGGEAA